MPAEAQRLRIYVGQDATCQGAPLAAAIVRFARERGLAGATVFHGSGGFGANSRVHGRAAGDLSQDDTAVVEIVDAGDKLLAALPDIEALVGEGMITLEKVRVQRYRAADIPE